MNERQILNVTGKVDNRTFPEQAPQRKKQGMTYGVIDNRAKPVQPGRQPQPVKPISHNSIKCPECGAVAAVKRTITEEDSKAVIRECECTNTKCKSWNKDKARGFRFKA